MTNIFADYIVQIEVLSQLFLSMMLGAIIGLDRELAKKPAGMRTMMLVSGSATLLVRLSEFLVHYFKGAILISALQADPIRITVAIVTGVSFIGAGTIIRSDNRNVEGVTTAATLLFSAALGIAVALSYYILAIGAALLAVLILFLFKKIENLIERKQDEG